MPFIILGILLILLVLWFITTQKSLVERDELCRNALSQISVQQSSRWDALSAISALVKDHNAHEYKTLMDILQKRQAPEGAETAAEQEALLLKGKHSVLALAESYPELKSHTLYQESIAAVEHHEEHVRKARMVYNDTVSRFNSMVRGLPSSIVANYLNFTPKSYLREEVGKTDMPRMNTL